MGNVEEALNDESGWLTAGIPKGVPKRMTVMELLRRLPKIDKRDGP